MSRFVAFLRGINLGKRRLENAELRRCFEQMGVSNAAVFLASGNVIFESKQTLKPLKTLIERELKRQLGYEVPTVLRTSSQVQHIADHEPFASAIVNKTAGKLQVILLAEEPSLASQRTTLKLATAADHLRFDGSELYWLPAGNMSDSELNLGRDADLGLMTTRTHRTLSRIAAKFLRGNI